MRIKTAVIPVAGKGTRFQPITRAVAKELLPLVDTPTLHYIVNEAALSGIERIILVTSKNKSGIEDYFDHEFEEPQFKNIQVISIRQKNPRGLGHAVLSAWPAVGNEPFAVLLGDDVIDAGTPCTKQLIQASEKMEGAPVVGVMSVEKSQTSKYGIVGGKKQDEKTLLVEKLVEKPSPEQAPSCLAIPGRYILTPDIFPILETLPPGVGGEIQLTDALQALARKRKLYAYEFEGRRFDAGDRFGYLEANIHFALKRDDMRDKMLALMKRLSK